MPNYKEYPKCPYGNAHVDLLSEPAGCQKAWDQTKCKTSLHNTISI